MKVHSKKNFVFLKKTRSQYSYLVLGDFLKSRQNSFKTPLLYFVLTTLSSIAGYRRPDGIHETLSVETMWDLSL